MPKSSKEASLQTLERLLGAAFTLHQKGSNGARLGRSYGVADGYMLALLELEIATQQELTRVVAKARAERLGPATTVMAPGLDEGGSSRTSDGDGASKQIQAA